MWHNFANGFSGGVGAAFTAQREDVDARTFRTIDGEDFSVVRVFGAWQATRVDHFHARLQQRGRHHRCQQKLQRSGCCPCPS